MTSVALISGIRTPFVKAGAKFSSASALQMGTHVVEALLKKLSLDAKKIDELAFSSVLLDPRTPNLAREIVLRSDKLPKSLSAHFVSNNCISGLVAANMIFEGISSGRITNGVAGGVESMSRPTLALSHSAEKFWLKLNQARSLTEKLKTAGSFRPRFILPIPPSPKEPSTGLTMGEHCELMAKEFQISRATQDEIALRSHLTAAAARKNNFFASQIEPFLGVAADNLIREDTTLEKLSKLPPVFDRSATGTLTAGNSSALTDGASCVYLMNLEQAKKEGRAPLAVIEGFEFASVAPSEGLLMAPVIAVAKLLKRFGLTADQIGVFEIHEAFAAQVAANLKCWKEGWARHPEIGRLGEIPTEKINIHGGSIALGHPFAATGGRLLLTVAEALKEKSAEYGIVSVCAAGGMGCSVLVRNTSI
jgi:acetyl-CoA acetyltransferase family protein